MCGIVGYVGSREACNIIVSGLHRLEYRGYDSAGVALCHAGEEQLKQVKATGKISSLEERISSDLPEARSKEFTLGIGHTRWATHGAPTEENAHPHLSNDGQFAIVHNGIIENYTALKDKLLQKGYRFESETDSEVIVHLIAEFYEGDLRQAVAAAIEQLKGAFGIAVISTKHPDTIVAARRGSPICVGVRDDETIVASDVSAIISHTDKVIFLNDGDILTASAGNIDITNFKNVPVTRELTHIDWDVGEIEKSGYEHFMLKEIHEQPQALGNAIRGRLLPEEGNTKLSGLHMDPFEMARIDNIVLAACGTSLYAAMVGKYFFEDLASIPADVQQAAEFRYRNPIIKKDTCMIAVSQSGETADTLAAVREAHRKGATVLGICNVVGSTIAREAGRGVYLHAGPEIGVASTKAFTSQVTVLAMMAILLGRSRRLSMQAGEELVNELARLPELVEQVTAQSDHILKIAEKYAACEDFFYIGRGYMYPAAMEGALKLKEISYIHAEGYHAAELKHGPIALLKENVPVVACVPDSSGKIKTIGNIQECKARNAPVIGIGTEGDKDISGYCDDVIWIPPCNEIFAPIPIVAAEQLLAYHIANIRGCSIDQPRNLAKSVTVE